jgi:hypothetical protein
MINKRSSFSINAIMFFIIAAIFLSVFISIIIVRVAEKKSAAQALELKAEAVYTDSSRKDITSLASWEITKKRILKIDKGLVKPRTIGETQVFAGHEGIRSNPANIRVKLTLGWLLWILFKIILFLLSLILVVLLILYFLNQRKKDKIVNYVTTNPMEFIIMLYKNANRILFLFGLRYKDVLPPLAYGRLVEKNYLVKDNLFLEFTMKYAEAKYSRHNLINTHALAALDEYNNFLKIVLAKESKIGGLLKHLLCLLKQVPLFITL